MLSMYKRASLWSCEDFWETTRAEGEDGRGGTSRGENPCSVSRHFEDAEVKSEVAVNMFDKR